MKILNTNEHLLYNILSIGDVLSYIIPRTNFERISNSFIILISFFPIIKAEREKKSAKGKIHLFTFHIQMYLSRNSYPIIFENIATL